MELFINVFLLMNNIINLREFYDICEFNICGLEVLDVKVDFYGNFLILILLKKILEELMCFIFRVNLFVDKCLIELRMELWKEIEMCERSYIVVISERVLLEDEVLVLIIGIFFIIMD